MHSNVGQLSRLWARDDAPNGVPANEPMAEQETEPVVGEVSFFADRAN